MKPIKTNVVSFYELSEEWQMEAKSNLDDLAEDQMYLEPLENTNPIEHGLWDLSECMPCKGNHEGFEYNASITISNNSAMLISFSDDMEEAEYIYV